MGQLDITMGGLTPCGIIETCLVHGLPAGGEVESMREVYSPAFASMGHCDSQCPGGN